MLQDTDNKRVAKNSIMLYMRMMVTMVVGFYTSRVVLQVLGEEDFGVYGLVEYQKKNGHALPLHVCSFKDHECCVCDKCFRSVVQIVAEGGDPRDFVDWFATFDFNKAYREGINTTGKISGAY